MTRRTVAFVFLTALLASMGTALVGTGLILFSREGQFIDLGNAVLAAFAWCF